MAFDPLYQLTAPPNMGAYQLPDQYQGYSHALVLAELGEGVGRESWSRAGYFWVWLYVPGAGFRRTWRYSLYLRHNLITLPTTQTALWEFEPAYWISQWRLEVWGQTAAAATVIDGGIYG